MKIKRWIVVVSLSILAFMLAACDGNKKGTVTGSNYYYPKTEESEATETESAHTEQIEAVFESDIYLIVSNDMAMEQMILKQMASGRQYLFYYSLTTRFLDKYENNTSVTEFYPGRMITIGEKDSQGKLKEMQISDAVWEYEDIVRFSIDEERGIFEIADTKYTFDEDVFVVSNENQISLSEIGASDELRVIGMNKEILSVAVTTGQGVITLKNTEVFEGSFIQIGKKIFAEITGEISLTVPEGTYMVSVANKGYGGSKEVVVERGMNTELDLDELKGEGPKKGLIYFVIIGEGETEVDAALKIDGKAVPYAEGLALDYGIHSIQISASGYEKFEKKLFVNSESATITITLSEESEETDAASTENEASGDLAGSQAGSAAGSLTGSSGSSSDTNSAVENMSEEQLTDYLSTFTEILGNVMD